MREIKFRAWDGKRMFHESFCEYLNGYGCLFQQFEKPEALMQYTGLKDKNGKEIYEGDIVKGITCKGDGVEKLLGKMFFDEAEAEYCIEQNNDYFPVCSIHVTDKNSLEVIGNIYENPELLKLKNDY